MQKIIAALLAALASLASFFASRDTWTAIIGLVTFLAAKYHWNVDATTLWAIAGFVIALLGHSAMVNHGSAAAVANQETARLQLEHTRLTARLAGMNYEKPEAARHNSQAGSALMATLAMIAVLGAIVGVGACAWWNSTGKAKTAAGSKAAAGCALGDVAKYLGDYQGALGSDGYDQAVADVEKENNLTADLTTCAVKTIFTVLTSRPANAPSTSQPTPVVLHAQAYLAKHGAAK